MNSFAAPLSSAPRIPPPSWPIWLIFAVLIAPGLVLLFVLGASKDSAAGHLALQEDAVGHSVVVTGVLTGVDTSSGLPRSTGIYTVTVPATADKSSESLKLDGDDNWGFPPSNKHPAELSYLIVTEGTAHPVLHGPVGTIAPVTAATVSQARDGYTTARVAQGVGIGLYLLAMIGLPTVAIIFAVRRHHAKNASRTLSATPLT